MKFSMVGRGSRIVLRGCVLALIAGAASLFASPVTYDIAFSTEPGFSVGALPTGSFTWDPTAGFSNFMLEWGGNAFDITSFADTPLLAADPPTGCTGAAADPHYGFLLLSQSVTGCSAQYGWLGIYYALDLQLTLSLEVAITPTEIAQDEITALIAFPAAPSPSFNETIGGSWTITPELSSTPEPSSIWLMLFGGVALAALRTFRRRRA